MINMILKILEEKVRAKTIEIGAQDTKKDLLKGLKNVSKSFKIVLRMEETDVKYTKVNKTKIK